jgi:hypothetical protein
MIKMIEHICNICGKEFENHSLKANHIRWKHNDQVDYIKKDSKDKKRRDNINLGEIKDFNVKCENCNIEFIVKEREFKFPKKEKYFCCRSCANTRNLSNETKDKISKKVKECWKNLNYSEICIKNLINKRSSSIGEREIRKILKERYGNINVSSHRIIEYNNIRKSVDLTIKIKNVIIEYDGAWHFDKSLYERVGTPEKYDKVIEKDNLTKEYCSINSIRLLRVGDKYYQHNRRKTMSEIINFIENMNLDYMELYI